MKKDIESKKQIVSAYQQVFSSESGKLVLFDLMKSCNILVSSMDANPHETSFNEGARSVVLRILQTIKTDPRKFAEYVEAINKGDS